MQFFAFSDITTAANCVELAKELYGAVVSGGRCNAAWRGGDGPTNVSIDKDKWYDHRLEVGGGAIQLVAYKFGGNIQQAQNWLGERYRLTPKCGLGKGPARHSRYEDLIADGYSEVKRYEYRDLDGNVVHYVARLEHPTKKKEFCQGANGNWYLGDVETILYNLRGITDSDWCAIVEGEKKADILIQNGVAATTCCGGAKKWRSDFVKHFTGKSVIIMPDNDDPGREHAHMIAADLVKVCKEIKIVVTSTAPKGDVYDYLTTEGHTIDDLFALMAGVPSSQAPASISSQHFGPTDAELADAKQANRIPFRNYIPTEKAVEKRGKTVTVPAQEPRTHRSMMDDIYRRFLNFPRKTGDANLFDFDRDSGEVINIESSDNLMAWIGRRSNQAVDWATGSNMATKRELFCSVIATAHRYESISPIPSYPRRDDVYYSHGALPEPCPNHSRFREMVDLFCPTTPEDKVLIAAFICSPLWYIPGIPRPSWIVDSKDGPGCGKTTLVELVAQLYGSAPISTSRKEMDDNLQNVYKRCLCQSGRNRRVLLMDNVTGNFECDNLSVMITQKHITGMAPYGHGEESRPNDLVYAITTNQATVCPDLAERSMYIKVSRPKMDLDFRSWKAAAQDMIEAKRLEIVSDIIHILSTCKKFDIIPSTRFPEWEATILHPCAGSPDAIKSVVSHILAARKDSNVGEEQTRAVVEEFTYQLKKMGLDNEPCFIRSEVVNSWGGKALQETLGSKSKEMPIKTVRMLANSRTLKCVNPLIDRWPRSSLKDRYKGVAWNFPEDHYHVPETVNFVYREGDEFKWKVM